MLKSAVQKAKLDRDEEVAALKRFDDQARQLEGTANWLSLSAFIASKRGASPSLDGR